MIKFKQPMVVYINQLDRDFVFRQGYSYMCDKIDDGYRIWNIDKSVVVEIIGVDVGEYLETT